MVSNDDHADHFDKSGLKHLMSEAGDGASSSPMIPSIDWDNEEHRRSMAACLVKAIYVMENDRSKCRMYTKALAPPWWESFHFRCHDVLTDTFTGKNDQFTFGAIFEHVPADGASRHPSAPHYVVAFGGTMLRQRHAIDDLYHDVMILANELPRSKRCQRAHDKVRELIDSTGTTGKSAVDGCGVVWLAGHSLGASLALDVGRTMMADKGRNVPTFLFNPPQVSLSPVINLLRWTPVARDLYSLKSGLGETVMRPHKERMEEVFEKLSPWVPELYVNKRDIICRGFIDYFELRQQVPDEDKWAMALSYRDMLFSVLGMEKEQPHLLPSATLWKNSSARGDPHGLKQWWKPDVELRLSVGRYSYPAA